eukprot:scaffold44520_cov226-Skeletonema_marinoi.AAC.1
MKHSPKNKNANALARACNMQPQLRQKAETAAEPAAETADPSVRSPLVHLYNGDSCQAQPTYGGCGCGKKRGVLWFPESE